MILTMAEQIAEYMHWASWMYKGKPFRAYQIIWPSTTGVFLWEPGANEWFVARQPLLARSARSASGRQRPAMTVGEISGWTPCYAGLTD
jgi:hypothetical protein